MATTPEERKAAAKAARVAARRAEAEEAKAVRVAARKSAQEIERGQRIAERRASAKNNRILQRLQARDSDAGKAPKSSLAAYGRDTSTWYDMTDNGSIAGINLQPPVAVA
jgi:hypothetical protein